MKKELTQEQILERKAKKAAYDKERRLRMKKAKERRIEAVREKSILKQVVTKNTSTNDLIDTIEITRSNVKYFHRKKGSICVKNSKDEVIHKGRTLNMGKVFSSYVNCHKYNYSNAYKFNFDKGDRLFFKEEQ